MPSNNSEIYNVKPNAVWYDDSMSLNTAVTLWRDGSLKIDPDDKDAFCDRIKRVINQQADFAIDQAMPELSNLTGQLDSMDEGVEKQQVSDRMNELVNSISPKESVTDLVAMFENPPVPQKAEPDDDLDDDLSPG